MPPPILPPPGRRERKKAETRRAISDVATRLFMERGFDEVTLAEVAEAADVSIKTILNHFGSKEELFLDRGGELTDTLVAAVTERPRGQRPTDALRVVLTEHRIPGDPDWRPIREPEVRSLLRRFFATWEAAPSLRGAIHVWNERLRAAFADALAREQGLAEPGDGLRTMAAMLTVAVHLRHRAFVEAILADAPPAEIERRARAAAGEALDRVAAAFPDLDRPRA